MDHSIVEPVYFTVAEIKGCLFRRYLLIKELPFDKTVPLGTQFVLTYGVVEKDGIYAMMSACSRRDVGPEKDDRWCDEWFTKNDLEKYFSEHFS